MSKIAVVVPVEQQIVLQIVIVGGRKQHEMWFPSCCKPSYPQVNPTLADVQGERAGDDL